MGKNKGKKTKKDPGSNRVASLNLPFGLRNASKATPSEPIPESVYANIHQESSQMQSLKYLFDHMLFRQYWQMYEKKKDVSAHRALRRMIQIQTIQDLLRGRYFLPAGPINLPRKQMDSSSSGTTFHIFESPPKLTSSASPSTSCKYFVVDDDCLEAALLLKELNEISASSSNPGGGYRKGAAAQEENLHRRTNLVDCLEDPYQKVSGRAWSYPLPEFGGLYTPSALVFRRSERNGYAYLEKPVEMSFVSVSSYSNPPTEIKKTVVDGTETEEVVLSGSIISKTKRKIQAILEIASMHGHNGLVLSAFGCGAYGNPSPHMARLFKEVASYHGKFTHVVFSVLEDHNSFNDLNPHGKVSAFSEAFQTKVLSLDELRSELSDGE